MKFFIRTLLVVLIFSLGHGVMLADGGYNFDFVVAQKKEGDGTKKATRDMTVKNQKWSYVVTMENKSFKDVSDLEIKYVVFSRQDQPGEVRVIGHQEFQRHNGGTTIKTLRNNDKITFSTDSIALKVTELADGWEWASGASSTAKGALRGIWIRVYIAGQMVTEFTNPPELATKETFDPPPKQ